MTRKKKLESALTTAEHYRNYSQRLKGFLIITAKRAMRRFMHGKILKTVGHSIIH